MQKQNNFFDSVFERRALVTLGMLVLILLAIFLIAETIKVSREAAYVGYNASADNSITVSGTGEVKAQPNMATFSFSVEADGQTQVQAQTAMATNANAAIMYLKNKGISTNDIKTTDYSVSQKFETQHDSTELPLTSRQVAVGFTASESVKVTLRSASTVSNSGSILGGVANQGATNVSSLLFTIADDTSLKDEARAKAIEDAKSEANKLASQLNVHIVSVESFSENSGSGPTPLFRSAAMDSAALVSETPQLQTGENTITSNVTITYKIK